MGRNLLYTTQKDMTCIQRIILMILDVLETKVVVYQTIDITLLVIVMQKS